MNEIAPLEEFGEAVAAPQCPRAPVGLLAELTHRCPLQCPYCSNPLELERIKSEMTTAQWQDVMRQAGELGILQIHLSGGEPTVRQDLEDIVEVAAKAGLYTNLITAGVTLPRDRLKRLKDLGLDHAKVNVHGGACALGHPVGASGARLIVTLMAALKRYGKTRGVASLCIGGGEATAVAIELAA